MYFSYHHDYHTNTALITGISKKDSLYLKNIYCDVRKCYFYTNVIVDFSYS